MRLLSSLILLPFILCEEGPPASVQFAKRMISTLPELPEAIAGGLEGKPDGIKNMISTVLGDGLISQLVVNPMGVAEEVLPDLGLNKSEVIKNDPKANNSNISGSLFGKSNGLLSLFTTTQKTTTPEVMLVDGVPVRDFDEYIRKHNLEGTFTTRKPPAPTTRAPTAEEMADLIASRITPAPFHLPSQINNDDFANKFDLAMVDPRRLGEVNSLLRRAPQRFDTMGGPPGFIQSEVSSPLDPAINEVVTNMRIKGVDGLSTEDIKRMKNILETYEATLQTKEFISKRNQLQVLQVELEEQRKRIELQKKMEADLRAKAKEIETKKAKMEAQLREQLQSWNLSHLVDIQDGPKDIINLMELPEMNPAAFPQLIDSGITAAPPSPPPTTKSTPTSIPSIEETTEEEEVEITEEPTPPPTTRQNPVRMHSRDFRQNPQRDNRFSSTNVRFRVPVSTSIKRDSEDEPQCDCIPISPSALSGGWIPALASKAILEDVYEQMSSLLDRHSSSAMSCTRFQVAHFKKSFSSTEARTIWEFKTNDEQAVHRIQGQVYLRGDRTFDINIRNTNGKSLSVPLCILKTDEQNSYMLAVKSRGTCNQAALIVRDPEEFFSLENTELVEYLKRKKQSKELEPLEMVPFAKNCD